jgi:hypothetical protein
MAFEVSISGGVQTTVTFNLEIYASTQQALLTLEQALVSGQWNPLSSFTFEPESVQAGSGNATVLGGIQADTATGSGHGFTTFAIGAGHNTVPGATLAIGAGHNTVPGAQPSVFQFNASPSGGAHVIPDFGGSDKSQLIGYDTTSAFGQGQGVGGNTITLGNGKTEIVLNGFHNLHKTDFIK